MTLLYAPWVCCPSDLELFSFSRPDLRGILDAAAGDGGRPRRLQPAARLRRLSALGRRRRRRRRAGTKRRCHLISITTNRAPYFMTSSMTFPIVYPLGTMHNCTYDVHKMLRLLPTPPPLFSFTCLGDSLSLHLPMRTS